MVTYTYSGPQAAAHNNVYPGIKSCFIKDTKKNYLWWRMWLVHTVTKQPSTYENQQAFTISYLTIFVVVNLTVQQMLPSPGPFCDSCIQDKKKKQQHQKQKQKHEAIIGFGINIVRFSDTRGQNKKGGYLLFHTKAAYERCDSCSAFFNTMQSLAIFLPVSPLFFCHI